MVAERFRKGRAAPSRDWLADHHRLRAARRVVGSCGIVVANRKIGAVT
jgi:hypothetical protein